MSAERKVERIESAVTSFHDKARNLGRVRERGLITLDEFFEGHHRIEKALINKVKAVLAS